MANTIITKNSSTAGAAPSAASLTQGELAVNVTDKKLYTKDSSGSIIRINHEQPSTSIGQINFPFNGTTALPIYACTGLDDKLKRAHFSISNAMPTGGPGTINIVVKVATTFVASYVSGASYKIGTSSAALTEYNASTQSEYTIPLPSSYQVPSTWDVELIKLENVFNTSYRQYRLSFMASKYASGYGGAYGGVYYITTNGHYVTDIGIKSTYQGVCYGINGWIENY